MAFFKEIEKQKDNIKEVKHKLEYKRAITVFSS
jgi:KaiC/GvpD/RAD55 family RecA-like ATPase